MDLNWDNSVRNRHNLRSFIALGGEKNSIIKLNSHVTSKNKDKLVRDYCIILYNLIVHTHYLDPLLYDKIVLKINNQQAIYKYQSYLGKDVKEGYFKKIISSKTQEFKKTIRIDPIKLLSIKKIDNNMQDVIKDEILNVKNKIKKAGYRYKGESKEALDSLVINLEDFVTLPVVRYGAVNSTENELIETIDYIFENFTKSKVLLDLVEYEPQIRDLIYLLNSSNDELDNNNQKKMKYIERYIQETYI